MKNFTKFAWGVLGYNIAVVVWGAYVRASKAGAGCGDHWPGCQGQIIPLAPTVKTLIEFTHRATSGIAALLVVGLLVWAWRLFPKRHAVRFSTLGATGLIIVEALIGAVLVKKGLVAENSSLARAVVIAIHLVNTLLLLGCLALTAWWSTVRKETGLPVQFTGRYKDVVILSLCLLGIIALSATGAITALGATLFPVTSLAEGMARDLSPRHVLESLIWIHPAAAVLVSLALTFAVVLIGYSREGRTERVLTRLQVVFFLTQLLVGGINLLLHAPVWLQLVHLFVADLVWVNLVLFTAAVLAVRETGHLKTAPVPEAYAVAARS